MSKKIIKYLTVATAFLLSTGVIASQTNFNEYSQRNTLVQDKDYGTWKHRAIDEGDSVTILVELAKNDLSGINDYINANLELGKGLFSGRNREVNVTIVFKKPMPESDIKTLLGLSISKVREYQIRVFSDSGQPITIGGIPSPSAFLPTEMMDVMVKGIEGSLGKSHVSGFILVDMPIDLSLYSKLIKSPDVLLVDLTAKTALDDFQREAPLATKLKPTYAHSAAPSVYWIYEAARLGK